jgi:predicted metal-dependent phosphoesterase TrpH
MIPSMLPGDLPVDLHLHTRYSDGHWEPAALVAALAEAGFGLAAVCDHDSLAPLAEVAALGVERGVGVLPGVEVTTNWHGRTAHLLCYARVLPADGALARLIDTTAAAVRANTTAVRAALERRGYNFPRGDEVLASMPDPLARPASNARLLLAHGYATTMDDALALIAEAGYQIITAPLADAVAAAHADGALALLAHPGREGGEIPRYSPELLARVCDEIALDGIEAYYPLHAAEQTASYVALAGERGLLISAGSDSHGPRQRLPVPYPARDVAPLLARLGIVVQA